MKKAILVLGLGAAVGLGMCARPWSGSTPAPVHEANLTLDRIWIDHVPRNDREVVQLFVAITDEPFGVFNAASAWKGSFEVFRYEAHGDQIRALYPQTGQRETIGAKATRCNANQMDFCLELSGASRGVKRYYSRKGWEIDGARSVDDIQHRAHQVLSAATE